MTRAEKVARAQELRAGGALLREIAEAMGVPLSTVSDWLSDPDGSRLRARKNGYRGQCIDCGAATDGSNGRANAPTRCQPCANRARAVWSRGLVVVAIRRFADRYGRAPHATDFNVHRARALGHHVRAERFLRDGDYPSIAMVQYYFGSWNAAIVAAGFEPFDYDRDKDWQRGRPSVRAAA